MQKCKNAKMQKKRSKRAISCLIVRYRAVSCDIGHRAKKLLYLCTANEAITCNTLQYRAIPCSIVQYRAISCSLVQFSAV